MANLSTSSAILLAGISDVTQISLLIINQTANSAPRPPPSPEQMTMAGIYAITIPVLLVVCILSILANGFILVAVECLQIRVKSPLLTLTLSLTASDAWVALVMAISFVVNSYLDKVIGESYKNVSCILLAFEAFRMGAMITSVLHLLVLALNHYVGILRPLHYNTTMTPEITIVSIIILWLVPPAGLLISFAAVPDDGFLSDQCKNPVFYFSYNFRLPVAMLVIVPLVAMVGIYIHIFIVIFRTQRDIEVTARPPHLQRKTKAIVTTLLVLGTFGLGWLPAVMRFILVCNDCIFTREDLHSWSPVNRISQGIVGNCLILLKCLLDPIIYAARIREINLGLKAMYWTRCGMKKMCGMNRSRTLRMTLSYASRNVVLTATVDNHCLMAIAERVATGYSPRTAESGSLPWKRGDSLLTGNKSGRERRKLPTRLASFAGHRTPNQPHPPVSSALSLHGTMKTGHNESLKRWVLDKKRWDTFDSKRLDKSISPIMDSNCNSRTTLLGQKACIRKNDQINGFKYNYWQLAQDTTHSSVANAKYYKQGNNSSMTREKLNGNCRNNDSDNVTKLMADDRVDDQNQSRKPQNPCEQEKLNNFEPKQKVIIPVGTSLDNLSRSSYHQEKGQNLEGFCSNNKAKNSI